MYAHYGPSLHHMESLSTLIYYPPIDSLQNHQLARKSFFLLARSPCRVRHLSQNTQLGSGAGGASLRGSVCVEVTRDL